MVTQQWGLTDANDANDARIPADSKDEDMGYEEVF